MGQILMILRFAYDLGSYTNFNSHFEGLYARVVICESLHYPKGNNKTENYVGDNKTENYEISCSISVRVVNCKLYVLLYSLC